MKIFLVDYLGIHCGMHYYLEAFKIVLQDKNGYDVEILSNFTDSESQESSFFRNQYKGKFYQKGISLLINLYRLNKFVTSHKDNVFIYLTYGNSIDLSFMKIISKAPFHVIDIHEAIAQNVDKKLSLKAQFKKLYSAKIKAVISHSSRTDEFLQEYGYRGLRFEVPHFKYVFPKEYNNDNISTDLRSSIDHDRINLLFFGNLNKSKGIDILMEAYNGLDDETASKVNLIIAGKDFDGVIGKIPVKSKRNIHIFKRHISDDELRFLYQNVDYICLPYRKTSQSGILEMAFYFKKPIIASDVPYFRKTLNEFPSFGVLSGSSIEDYIKTLTTLTSQHEMTSYFSDSDYARYEYRHEIENFKRVFSEWISSL